MSLLDYFKTAKPSSAAIAKERLQILVAHERSSRHQPLYLPQLKKELMEVIQRYFKVSEETISVSLEQDDEREVLELNIILPDEEHFKHLNSTTTKGK
jgi:cell division topological specificity factor